MCYSFVVTLNNYNEYFIVSTNDAHAGNQQVLSYTILGPFHRQIFFPQKPSDLVVKHHIKLQGTRA